jgi:hypothetical protein
VEFANITTVYPADTLKLTIIVEKWQFSSLANSLVIVMDSGSSSTSGLFFFLLFSHSVEMALNQSGG